jgi:hypothetical protein
LLQAAKRNRTQRKMMLRADRIELALLNLILDWKGGPLGPTYRLYQYREAVLPKVGDATEFEVVECLRVLEGSRLISIDRYIDSTPVPYNQSEGDAFFLSTSEAFRCIARPGARRRQQELAGQNREGVFISHIGEERPVALRLQQLLESALSPKPPVFVSSDYDSIKTGEEWYRAILDGLRRSQVVIILLSRQSVDRRWINFEAGFGLGQESQVMPVVWRNLTKGDVGPPLGLLHTRELADNDECAALLRHLAALLHLRVDEAAVPEFVRNAENLQQALPSDGQRSPAEQARYDAAQAGIDKLGPDAVEVLRYLRAFGPYAVGHYSPPPPAGLNGNRMRDVLSSLVDAQLVRWTITNHVIDERTYEIAPGMAPVLDELLYH